MATYVHSWPQEWMKYEEEVWYNGTISTTAATTWGNWVNTTTSTGAYVYQNEVWTGWQQPYNRIIESEADRLQRQREYESRRELRRQQEAQAAEQRVLAHARALDLLEMILSPAQKLEMKEKGRIPVTAPSGRLYLVETDRHTVHGNIIEVDEHGCRLRRACVAPGMYGDDGALPTPDGWVGQVLALQHNEDQLRAMANWSEQRRCQHPGVPILGQRAA